MVSQSCLTHRESNIFLGVNLGWQIEKMKVVGKHWTDNNVLVACRRLIFWMTKTAWMFCGKRLHTGCSKLPKFVTTAQSHVRSVCRCVFPCAHMLRCMIREHLTVHIILNFVNPKLFEASDGSRAGW